MMKKQKVTLIEVAELAGVSRAAAGKVLNGGSDKIGVGAEARKRILEAARKLNYQPNMAASILAGGSSRLIGVLLDPGTSYRYLRLLGEIESLCQEQGYRIITSFTHENIVNMEENYRTLLRYGVSGVICCAHDYPGMQTGTLDFFSEENNIVFMEKPVCKGLRYVATSRVKALTAMIASAQESGYRKIAMFSASLKWRTEAALHEEFYQAMRRNGLEPDPHLVAAYPDEFSLPKRLNAMMDQVILPYHPDFVYIDDAVHAAALQIRLLEHGIKIRIYGGNDDPLFQGLGLSSFDPCYRKIAQAMLNLLMKPDIPEKMPVIEAVYRGCL